MYKIDRLLKQDQKLFHTNDLMLLWEMENKNTLYTTIKRYVQKGILVPIHKGFYSTVTHDQIDPLKLAIGALHRYAYLSCETILAKHGIIFQHIPYYTFVSDISRTFKIKKNLFKVRKLSSKYLFNDCGISSQAGVPTAGLNRAAADMLFFNPKYNFDNKKGIDFKKVKQIQKEVVYI